MKPLPWSYSSLADFVNCPRAFHAKRVVKTVKESESDEMIWGNRVHKCFEERIKHQKALPDYLREHEPFLTELDQLEGLKITERKIALNVDRRPCQFFSTYVWMRGIIDFLNVHGDGALVVDYKTGKPHSNLRQLKLFALHVFAEFREVEYVTTKYYWTKTCSSEPEHTFQRNEIPVLWNEFAPDLKQYVTAFRQDTWQARPSGLCRGWCPVTTCEHWTPRKGG